MEIVKAPFFSDERNAWCCSLCCKSRMGVFDDKPLTEGKSVYREMESKGAKDGIDVQLLSFQNTVFKVMKPCPGYLAEPKYCKLFQKELI